MMWFQLKIEHCPVEKIEQLSEELEKYGALSIILTDKNDNPVLEPEPGTTPLWPEVIIQALFSKPLQAQRVREQLSQASPKLGFNLEVLENKDWERVWMDDFKPRRFGNRLWICPSWTTPPDPNAVNLMLDPGLAFGTGTHPTTSLCLEWLEQAKLEEQSVIDYGCGSGILSLATLKLGAKIVYAVDIDQQALQATQSNALTNKIEADRLLISFPQELVKPVNLIIANILLTPLITLKERFQNLIHPDGKLVISGLLEEQTTLLIEAYESEFIVVGKKNLNGWSLLTFTRK